VTVLSRTGITGIRARAFGLAERNVALARTGTQEGPRFGRRLATYTELIAGGLSRQVAACRTSDIPHEQRPPRQRTLAASNR